jgi:hypothetical protein
MLIHHSIDAFFSALKRYDIMPSTDRKLELKAKTSVAQTASHVAVYAKGIDLSISYVVILTSWLH